MARGEGFWSVQVVVDLPHGAGLQVLADLADPRPAVLHRLVD